MSNYFDYPAPLIHHDLKKINTKVCNFCLNFPIICPPSGEKFYKNVSKIQKHYFHCSALLKLARHTKFQNSTKGKNKEKQQALSNLMLKQKQGMFLFVHPNSLIRMCLCALGLCQGKASWETWLALPNPSGYQKACYYHDIYTVFRETRWNERTTKG